MKPALLSPSAPPAIAAQAAQRRAALAAAAAQLYPGPATLTLELGCGHGHFLTAYAAAHPGAPCLGVDLSSHRIARAQRKQQRLGLANLAFLKAEAEEILAALPEPVRLGGVLALFPDPWPKVRHHGRRLLQPRLLDALAARARPGAWLAVRTDHEDFFTWAAAQIAAHPAWRLAPEMAWPFEHPTVFQERQSKFQSLLAVRR